MKIRIELEKPTFPANFWEAEYNSAPVGHQFRQNKHRKHGVFCYFPENKQKYRVLLYFNLKITFFSGRKARMAEKKLASLSHWNVISDWSKFSAQYDGFLIKATQGSDYKDPAFESHMAMALNTGKPVGAWHFLDNSNPLDQANNFKSVTKGYNITYGIQIDCEAFTSVPSATCKRVYAIPDQYPPGEIFPYVELRQHDVQVFPDKYTAAYEAYYGLEWPTLQNLDAVGRYISGYMGFQYPDIYSNPSTLYRLRCPKSMARYGLWVAHWGVESPTVVFPWTVWKLWQTGIVDGVPYGVEGDIDNNEWNPKNNWPWDNPNPPPPPPPTPGNKISPEIYIYELGKTYKGDLEEV